MTSKADRTAGQIDWPAWAERTQPADRERTHKFSVTQTEAITDLEEALLQRVGADDWRLSTAAPHRKGDGLPYADANPDDPAVVVRWTKDGEQYCVACDHYTSIRDNARSIGLYVEEKRKMANRPVQTGQDEFATARLPPGEDEASGDIVVAGNDLSKEPHEVLGVSPDAPPAVVEGAARSLKAETHPDKPDGDRERYIEVSKAEEAMLNG